MSRIPAVPSDASAVVSCPVTMRYEDVAQDGRVLVESLATSVNEALWGVALRGHPIEAGAFDVGVLAILSRFVVEGSDGPFGVEGPFEAECRFVIARGVDAASETTRLYLNAWVDTFAPIGRSNFPPPANTGARALVGRAFAEHVFTRPFAAPDARRVTSLGIAGMPDAPPHVYEAECVDDLLALSVGGDRAEYPLELDAVPIVFGLRHTDSNQHVNSLVYPQLFEEACLRRMAARGLQTNVLARTLEIAYRKPCFAGQTVHVALRLAVAGGVVEAAGGIYAPDGDDSARILASKPHAYVRMTFTSAPE